MHSLKQSLHVITNYQTRCNCSQAMMSMSHYACERDKKSNVVNVEGLAFWTLEWPKLPLCMVKLPERYTTRLRELNPEFDHKHIISGLAAALLIPSEICANSWKSFPIGEGWLIRFRLVNKLLPHFSKRQHGTDSLAAALYPHKAVCSRQAPS